MRELSEATMDRIEFALVDQEAVLDDIGNSPERVDTARALAEFREWRAELAAEVKPCGYCGDVRGECSPPGCDVEKATEPGECEACIGYGWVYGTRPRSVRCPRCNGARKRKGGEHG